VPGDLVESTTTTETPLGPIRTNRFTLHRGAFLYSVVYIDSPIPGLARANELGALEGALGRIIELHNAELVSKRDVLLDSAPGIEFRGKFAAAKDADSFHLLYGRVYLFDARLYQITVVTDNTNLAEPTRFLNSFQFTRRPL
jgi:hypothetical protein